MLSIIILSYNTLELTRQCLQSLVNLKDLTIGKDFEVVVVDNASSDGSLQMIAQEFPQVKLVVSKKNLGFSRGNNLGLKHISSSSDYVLFLNSDTVVPSGTLSQMLEFMDQDRSIGMSTCKVMLWVGGVDLDCHRGLQTPWAALTHFVRLDKIFPKSRLFAQYYQTWKDLNETHEVDAVLGAFMLCRREALEKVGNWDEDFFFYGEDLDFCRRFQTAGYKIVYYPHVTITHYKGASSGIKKESRGVTQASRETKERVLRESTRAMRLFYDKHMKDKYPWLVDWLVYGGIRVLTWWRLLRLHLS